MEKKMVTCKTFLPVFPGFYGTWFDGESEQESALENLKEELEKRAVDLVKHGRIVDRETFSQKFYEALSDFHQSVARRCCQSIEKELKEFSAVVSMENIHSPKEYNFTNDSINCTIEIDSAAVLSYLATNADKWKAFIKERFSSRSGFISFHSHNADDWNADKLFGEPIGLGTALDFILENEGYESNDLYDDLDGQCYFDLDIEGVANDIENAIKENEE